MRIHSLFALVLLCSTACGFPPPDERTIQAMKAREAANHIDFDNNAEINNIEKRLKLTSRPGLIGYILLLNDSGQPVLYTTVQGKVTSSGKRLTQPYVSEGGAASPSDEGTYGSSDPYVYFWTEAGQYVQWSGDYLYSDQPIRTSIAPLVIEMREASDTK